MKKIPECPGCGAEIELDEGGDWWIEHDNDCEWMHDPDHVEYLPLTKP